MKLIQLIPALLLTLLLVSTCDDSTQIKNEFKTNKMMVRIAEIEVDSNYIEEYITILKKEAAESIKLEPGVLCIYPMFQKENPTQFRLLEIYENEAAYQTHLKTPHFLHYKTSTLNMVTSLKLIDMEAIDEASMPAIFKKMKK